MELKGIPNGFERESQIGFEKDSPNGVDRESQWGKQGIPVGALKDALKGRL